MLAAFVAGSLLPAAGWAQQPPAVAQPLPPGQTAEPFRQAIISDQGIITVRLREFASLPDIDAIAARAMTLTEEPGTHRLFVSDMRGPLIWLKWSAEFTRDFIQKMGFNSRFRSCLKLRGMRIF